MKRPKMSSITALITLMLSVCANSFTPTSNTELELEIRSNSSLPYVAIGDKVVLDCVLLQNNRSVKGVEVEWEKNGDLQVEKYSDSYYDWIDTFKTSSLLTIKDMQRHNGGVYKCKATYHGNFFTATVELRTMVGLTFSPDCQTEQAVLADHTEGMIKCRASLNSASDVPASYSFYGEYPEYFDQTLLQTSTAVASIISDVHIRWYKNDVTYVPPSGRCHVNDSVGIVCDEFVEADAGRYTIVARMTSPVKKTLNRTIVVEVLTLPHIHNLPTEVVAVENSTVKLTCTATGNPPPTYKWYSKYDLTVYRPLKRFRYDTKSGTLIISDVSRHDAGLISCFAENSAGGDLRNVKLVVTTAEGSPFEEDQETIISPAHDLLFNGSPNSNASFTAASNSTAFYVYVLFCFSVVFFCLLMFLFFLDVGCCVIRRRGVMALLSNYLVWGKPSTSDETGGQRWAYNGKIKMSCNSGSTNGIMKEHELDVAEYNSVNYLP